MFNLKRYFTLLILLFAITSISIFLSCARKNYLRCEGMVWNTTYHIVYESEVDLTDSITAELKRVEASVSAFSPASVVSRINRNETTETDSAFREVYTASCLVREKSGGAFDPTLAPLINAYGFGYKDAPQPDAVQIKDILAYIGLDKTCLQNGQLIKDDPRTEFNFSAIAKGYGCDRVASMFRRNGVKNYMIEIGGEIRMAGKNPDKTKWNISIDKPVFSNDSEIHDSQAVIALTDCGMATSGNYRNFKEEGGKRFGHTIDTKTGRPAQNDMLSATVIVNAGSHTPFPCMMADAYATACMSMGSQKAQQMVMSEQLAAMFILADGTIWTSPSFPKYE